MAITLTPNKNLSSIGITDTGWGPPTNGNVATLDKALGNAVGIAAVGGTTLMSISDLQNMTIVFSGSLGSNAVYQIPTGVSGQWVIVNKTTGSHTLAIVSQSGGTAVYIPQSTTGTVYVNTSVVGGAIRADTPFTSASSDTQVIYNNSGNLIGSGNLTYSLGAGLYASAEYAATNTALPGLTVTRQSSGTPAVGIGVCSIYGVETAPGTIVNGAKFNVVSTSISIGAQSFDYAIFLMAGGVFSEKLRLTSAGSLSAQAVNGTWVATDVDAANGTSNTRIMTPQKVNYAVKDMLNVTGSAPMFACRAWVNFDGTSGLIRASGNVSSVVRHSTGEYTISFASAMPDSDYSMSSMTNSFSESDPGGNIAVKIKANYISGTPTNMTNNSVTVICGAGSGGKYDPSYVTVSFFR